MVEPIATTLRLFIAVPIPAEVKNQIATAQTQLQRALPDSRISWTKREHFHLTLKFLGDVEQRRVPSLTEAVDAACREFAPLPLRAEQIGSFPNARFPRVIWVRVADAQERLSRLQNALELSTRGFTTEQPERKFSGHVTLGRIKAINQAQAKILAHEASTLRTRIFGEWTADKIEILRSELLSAGARHTSLASIALAMAPCP